MAPKKGKAKAKGQAKKEDAPTEETPKDEAEAKKEDAPTEETPKAEAEAKKGDAPTEETPKGEAEAAKTEDVKMGEAVAEEEPPAPAEPTEYPDAPADERARVKAEQVGLATSGATPNTMPSADGRMLFTLCDGGLQYMLAGVRASAGIQAGCYAFEVRIVELLNPYEGRGKDGHAPRTPQPRHLVRLGFSTAAASPLLDEGAGKVYFDSDGHIVSGGSYSRVAGRFSRDQYVAVVVNLGGKPFANTVSLFVDGQRAADPQPIPEEMLGKALYPTITYKNVTLQVNLGPTPKKPLPFRCRMLKDASADDVALLPAEPAADSKREVLVPVGLPDQGVFAWADQFLEANPRVFELSDRKVLEWASNSGLHRRANNASNDKPGMQFNVPMMDDMSVQKTIAAVSPALRRDFMVLELKDNLLAAERKKLLARFPSSDFKRVAVVVMGEPGKEYKEKVHAQLLSEKVAAAEKEKAKKKREREDEEWRKAKQARYSNSGQDAAKAKQEEPKKEEPKKEEPADKDAAPKEGGEAKEEAKEEEAKEEPKEEPKEEVKEEEEAEKPVELTEEEKAQWHLKTPVPDLTGRALAESFADFSLPGEAEGFDEIRYAWQEASACAETLRAWVLDQKRTQRVESLEPSEWFKEKWAAWNKQLSEWKDKASSAKKRAPPPPAKKAEDGEEKKEEKKDGEDGAEDKKEGDAEGETGELDEDDVDPFTLEDLDDMGNGKPLYGNFVYEDWTLLSLRYELHLLVHAFRKDVNDPDRQSFHESHLSYYYSKYFRKPWNIKQFGVESLEDLFALVKDSVGLDPQTSFVSVPLPEGEPLDKFLRYTEDHRRERQRCIDAGDETACLKFTRPAPPPPQSSRGGQDGRRGGYSGSDRGRGGDYRGGQSGGDRRGGQTGQRGDIPRTDGRGGYSGSRGGYSDNRGGGYGGDRGGYGGDRSGGYGGDSRAAGGYGGNAGSRGSYGGGSSYGGQPAAAAKRPYQQPPGPPASSYPPAKQSRYETPRGVPPPRAGGGDSRGQQGGARSGGYGGGGGYGSRR